MRIQRQLSTGVRTRRGLWIGLTAGALAVIVVAGAALTAPGSHSATATLANNPYLDPGTPLSSPAPDFTLTDQFGKPVSLRSFRGKVVILAFNDSECTTICPLTTTAMVDARAMLGAAASGVQLLGIDANPSAISVEDVRRYSELHGMVRQWRFLTGSLSDLKQIWKAYKIDVAIEQGQIDHTPALFVIGPDGRLRKLYLTQQSYAAVPQLGQLLAQEATRLLPEHPAVNSRLSYAEVTGVAPTVRTTVPGSGDENVVLGPGETARLYLFFATWDQQVTNLGRQLDALNTYESDARAVGLPPLTAVDEATVEPSSRTLPAFLDGLPHRLSYSVGIDRSGRVADGYGVQDEPWFVLVSPSGRVLWYYDVSTQGWLDRAALERQLRAALTRGPAGTPNAAAVRAELTGSPPALAALHAQANRLLDGEPALAARIRWLRGYPIVINAWGSWCAPCRAEFGLFAAASAAYGRRVAFIGADVGDDSGDARAFLAQHPVSYPSYQMTTRQLTGVVPQGVLGTPTTIFINRAGKIVAVHTGTYEVQGTLDADIETNVLGG
jgi:cytochrome oxidase Cu insertion factor (SCO1/SenC/PrrC family)/thiol-disulfide isomerase/thioredoxin